MAQDNGRPVAGSHLIGARSNWLEFMQILVLWLLVAALSYGLVELAGLSNLIGYPVLWAWVATTPFLLWAAQRGVRAAVCRGFAASEPQRAVIVGVTDVGRRLASRIQKTPALATRVVGYFEDRSVERVPDSDRPQIVGKVAELPDYVVKHNINIVYVTIPLSRQRRITDLIDSLSDSTVSIYFGPDLFVFNLIPVPPLDGSHVMSWSLPPSIGARFDEFSENYGNIILWILFLTGLLRFVIGPPQELILTVIDALVR